MENPLTREFTVIIVVCIKQVPEVAAVKIDPKTKTLVREGVPSILNPFDEFAVEEALRIKEKHGGEVIIVTMGPPQAREAIMKCLAMGADRAIHLTDIAFSGADTLATSYTLAKAIRQHIPNFDIILCGKQAIDGDTAQVPPEISELLGIPRITGINKLEVDVKQRKVIAHKETDEGYNVIECKLPVLLTALKGLNEPRLPSFRNILTAKKKELRLVTAKELGSETDLFGLNGSPTQVVEVFSPEPRVGGIIIREEDPTEAAKKLVQFLVKERVF